MRPILILLASPALWLAAPAVAQPEAGTASSKTVEEVVVSGATPDVQTSIDRTSYNVAKDLATTSGSLADALRNIPALEVDVQGNVALRGDPNVTILVDGKPSGLFRGEGRAAALQTMPADQIERVEVITNPSAELSPEGGGAINLITKKARKPGRSGSLRASLGSEGRTNGGLTGAYNSEKLALNVSGSWRTDPQKFQLTDAREVTDPATGRFDTSEGRTEQGGDGHIVNLRSGVDYDLDASDRLSLEASFFQMQVDFDIDERFELRDADGAAQLAYRRLGAMGFDQSNRATSTTWLHRFKGPDHQLTVSAGYDVTELDPFSDFTLIQTSGLPQAERTDALITLRLTTLKADYVRPLGEAKLKLGYALEVRDNRYDNLAARGALDPDPAFTNLFKYHQAIHAGYATYERPFGDWTVLAGLRLEDVRIDIDQVTTGVTAENGYLRGYPSLHVSRALGSDQRVTLSYSRRVQRPRPTDLNPFLVYESPVDLSSGNADLQPQVTDSFEAAWQRRRDGTFYQASVYYRRSRHGVTDVSLRLPDGGLLTTKANLARGQVAGLELVANGKLAAKLGYNASVTTDWTEIEAGAIVLPDKRSGVAVGGRANLNWQPTAKDFFQVNAAMYGERLRPQGRTEPYGVLNLGYQHKLTDDVAVVVTWQDVLQTLRQTVVLDTPQLRQRQEFSGNARAVFVGVSWTFGGKGQKPAEPAFDYGGGT